MVDVNVKGVRGGIASALPLFREQRRGHMITVVPGFVATGFVATVTDEQTRSQLEQRRDAFAVPPSAIAEGIAFAIDQPEQVDINEITVRPTAQ